MMSAKNVKSSRKTFLGYELSSYYDAVINCLIPSIGGCILYILIIACDVAMIQRHYKNEDKIWASLSLFFMFFPSLASYVLVMSDWSLWPEHDGCGGDNMKWGILKTLQHLFFPVWQMWRYAERIFWSIEAIRSIDEEARSEAMSIVHAPRNIELYIFLQGYIHALPQVLLQLYILMRHKADINSDTVAAQTLSIIFNLAKVAITTTCYQRFKTQKLAGRQYPWFKYYKKLYDPTATREVVLRRKKLDSLSVVEHTKPVDSGIEDMYNIQAPIVQLRRHSSDIYLEPTNSLTNEKSEKLILETDFDEKVTTRVHSLIEPSVDEVDASSKLKERVISSQSEPDYNIKRVVNIMGMKEDDLAGKLIAFCWWFCFLLTRVLAVSAFSYFFPKPAIWLLFSHFLVIIAFLIYDVKSDHVKRSKMVFFLFIGYVYLFCIIEFKVKFKKAKFIYYGFFVLTYLENFAMCFAWYFEEMENLENDYWFRYIFYLIVMCTIVSVSSMLFYFNVNKPEKVVARSIV